jgi:hypothetical protein
MEPAAVDPNRITADEANQFIIESIPLVHVFREVGKALKRYGIYSLAMVLAVALLFYYLHIP